MESYDGVRSSGKDSGKAECIVSITMCAAKKSDAGLPIERIIQQHFKYTCHMKLAY